MHIQWTGSAYWYNSESLSPHLKSQARELEKAKTDLDLFYHLRFYRLTQPWPFVLQFLLKYSHLKRAPRPNSMPSPLRSALILLLFSCLFSEQLLKFHVMVVFPNHFLPVSLWYFLSKFMPHSHSPLHHLLGPLSLTLCPHISFWLSLSLGPLSLLSTHLSLFFILPNSLLHRLLCFSVYLLPIPQCHSFS